jgi:hypothetical protein
MELRCLDDCTVKVFIAYIVKSLNREWNKSDSLVRLFDLQGCEMR